MKSTRKTTEIRCERSIPAPLAEVFDGWLDPRIPGNPWNLADKFLLNPKVDGLFYWSLMGTPHYGRFTKMERPGRLQHTWMSPYTLGQETTVTVTFRKQDAGTLMTLVHSDLPNTKEGRSHEDGWNFFLNGFPRHFGEAAGRMTTKQFRAQLLAWKKK